MHIIKKLLMIVLIAQQTLLVSMQDDPCLHKDAISYRQIIPHETSSICPHIFECSNCCPNAQQAIVQQCLSCHQAWIQDHYSYKIKPKEVYHYQTRDELNLIDTCRDGDLQKLQQLLEAGTNPNTRYWQRTIFGNGSTPLMMSSCPEMTDVLLKYGANPNLMNLFGQTALWFAAMNQCIPIAQKLLAAKADPELHAFNAETPLVVALEGWLWSGRTDFVEILLEEQANPNHEPIRGKSPLFLVRKNQNMIKLLKQYGAVEKRAAL